MKERDVDDKICPETLPIFPLTGALLLPGGRLPLHVFEPRYRAMVEDALAGDGFIGMIQPYATGPVNYNDDAPDDDEAEGEAAPAEPEDDAPELFTVGCAGVIERWERLPDGRFIILLKGMARFRIREELEPVHGYRRVNADYGGFSADFEDLQVDVSSDRLMQALSEFGEAHQMPLDLDKLGDMPGVTLLNSIAMALPFQPAEKQALLEAADVHDRLEMLLALMDMGLDLSAGGAPPPLN